MWSTLEKVPRALEKNVYSVAFGCKVLYISVKSMWSTVSFKALVSLGSLGGAAVWRLPLAQGAIPETPDRIPRRALGAWSLLLPLPMSLPLSLSLSLSVCV